jgi:glutamate/tyrosine decarboxylase-like PLP-dependent enzyme
MADPLDELAGAEALLRQTVEDALQYLASLDERPVRAAATDAVAQGFVGDLPEHGLGGPPALARLASGLDGAHASAGPRFFHFVTGGGTPAALAADWLGSAVDQNSFSWVSSPLGAQLEATAVRWLLDLFHLPPTWGGVLTTGATMANFTALAAARGWWAEQHGVEVDRDGLAGLPAAPVFSSGHLHPSATKALAMLGLGRERPVRLQVDDRGGFDVVALEAALRRLDAPAIVIANAGEVNAGDFDPIEAVADVCQAHRVWLHVDGAFGLFARLAPETGLAAGVERADSAISDGHKWLNVPYDCGFAFVREPARLASAFTLAAAYLPDDEHPNFGYLGPESSRRARAFAVWATLAAYGRDGYRAMVERHLRLARRVAAQVEAADDLELLAPTRLNIVSFRFVPPGFAGDLDRLNEALGAAVNEDGRVMFGSTRYRGVAAFRPAITNWRTTEADVDLIVEVVRELGATLAAQAVTA